VVEIVGVDEGLDPGAALSESRLPQVLQNRDWSLFAP
jgi:hypothetical protein